MSINKNDDIDFFFGNEADYNSTKHGKSIVFALDTKQLILDSIKFIPKNVSELFNDAGYLTSVSWSQILSKPTTLTGYGITDWLFKFLGYSADIDDTSGWGVFHHNSSTVGLPSTYGSVLQWSNAGYASLPSLGGWYVQLFSSTNPNNPLYHRQRVNGGAWTEWIKILDEKNYTEYLYPKSTIDSKLGSIDSTSIINGTNNVWGGIDPVTLPLVAYERGNKLFGLKGDEVTVEYSTDGGTTWVEYAVTDNDKFNLFNDKGQWLRLGGSDDTISDDCMFRVTVNLIYPRYCTLNKILIYSTTAGASEFYCTLDRYNYDGNWYNVFTDKKLAGWSGNNVINFNTIYFNNAPVADYQSNKLRFTFRQVVGSSQTVNAGVMRIQGFGTTTWGAANNMMKYNRLYDVDIDMNAIFENGIYPYNNLTSNLGTSSNRWKTVYANELNSVSGVFSGTLNVIGLATFNSIKIGDATLTYDSANGGIKIDKGIYSDSYVSAKGIDTTYEYQCVAQFGIYFQDVWYQDTSITTFGVNSIDLGTSYVTNGIISITADVFSGCTVGDIEVFVYGASLEVPNSNAVCQPYAIDGTTIFFQVANVENWTGFKIKIYK